MTIVMPFGPLYKLDTLGGLPVLPTPGRPRSTALQVEVGGGRGLRGEPGRGDEGAAPTVRDIIGSGPGRYRDVTDYRLLL